MNGIKKVAAGFLLLLSLVFMTSLPACGPSKAQKQQAVKEVKECLQRCIGELSRDYRATKNARKNCGCGEVGFELLYNQDAKRVDLAKDGKPVDQVKFKYKKVDIRLRGKGTIHIEGS